MEDNLIYVDNSIFTKNPHIYLNLNTSLEKNLNVKGNTVIDNTLIVKKDSQFKQNLTIYGNLSILGESLNVVSEKTVIGDPLIVFGYNQTKTDNFHGGFLVNYNNSSSNYYSGLVRKPDTSNFYLYHNISSAEGQPNLNNISQSDYSSLYLSNLNVERNILIKKNATTTNLLVQGESEFINKITIKNDVQSDFYQFDSTNKLIKIDANTITQHILPKTDSTYDLGSVSKKYKNLYLSGNSFHLGTLHIKDKAGALEFDNLSVTNNTTTKNIHILGNMTTDNHIYGTFFQFNKTSSEFQMYGNTITQHILPQTHNTYDIGSSDKKIKDINIQNNIILDQKIIKVKENSINTDLLIIDKNITTTNLLVNGESQFKNKITINNNIQGEYYQFDNTNKLIKLDGNTISQHILPKNNSTFDLGSPTSKFRNLYLSGNSLYLDTFHIKLTDGVLTFSDLKITNNLTTSKLKVQNNSSFIGNVNIEGNYNIAKWKEIKKDALNQNIPLPTNNMVVPLTYGGTGATSIREARDNLFIKLGPRGTLNSIQNSPYLHNTPYDVQTNYFQPYSYALSYIDYIYNKNPNKSDADWKADEYKTAPKTSYNHTNFGVLNMFGLGTWPGTPNLNTMQNLRFNTNTITNNDNSSSTNTGALIIKGGLGIAKNIFVGENINIANDLIIQKNTTSNQLLVNDISQFKGIVTMNNNLIGEFYTLDKTNKQFRIDGDTISHNILPKTDSTYDLGSNSKKFRNLYLSANSFHLGTLHIKETNDALTLPNINITNNIITSNLLVNNQSQFKNKITINNDVVGEFYTLDKNNKEFNVVGNGIFQNLKINKNTNILGNNTIDNNLIVKQHTTTNQLLVNDSSQFKGVMTINNNIFGEFYNFNESKKEFTVVGNGIFENIKINKNTNILGNNTIDNNLIVKQHSTTNQLLVNDSSQFKGIVTINNNVLGEFYDFNESKKEFTVVGNGIFENIKINKNTNILGNNIIDNNLIVKQHSTTNQLLVNDSSQFKGIVTINNNILGEFYDFNELKKEFTVVGNGIFENIKINKNSNILGSNIIDNNLIVKQHSTTNQLLVNDSSQFKGVVTLNNNVLGEFYDFNELKKEFTVVGNGIFENIKVNKNSNILGNNIIDNNLIVKKHSTTNELLVNNSSQFKGIVTINNNVLGEFYNFNESKKEFTVVGNGIFENIKINKNSNILGNNTIDNNLIVKQHSTTNQLLVNDSSQFKGIITINNNVLGEFYDFNELKKEFTVVGNGIFENVKINKNSNILGNNIIDNNLIVKQHSTTNKLLVNDSSQFKGVVTLNNNVLGEFYDFNELKKEFTVVGNGIFENVKINKNSNILGNNIIDNNLIVKQHSTTNQLLVNDSSQFKGVVTINNNVFGEFYDFNESKKEFTVVGNGIFENVKINKNSNILGNNIIDNNLIVKKHSTTNQLLVNDSSQFKGVVTLNNNVLGEFYDFNESKKEFTVVGNGIFENVKINKNSNILGNNIIDNNLIVKQHSTTNQLLVNDSSQFKGVVTMNNNVVGEFYELNKNKKEFKINGNIVGDYFKFDDSKKEIVIDGNILSNYKLNINSDIDINKEIVVKNNLNVLKEINISGNLIPTKNEVYNLGSNTNKFKDLYLSGTTMHLGNKTIQLEGNDIKMDSLLINENAKIKKNMNIDDSIIIKENTNSKNIIVSNNIISSNITSEKLFVNKTSNFKDNIVIEKKVTGPFYVFDESKSELNVTGNIVSQKDLTIQGNSLINKNLIVNENVNIYGNLIVAGTRTFINTKHIDINDPIITIGNNVDVSNKVDSGLLIKSYNNTSNKSFYSGLIKKKNDENIYLVKNIDVSSEPIENVDITNKENLVLNNITTSSISEFKGGLFKDNILIPEDKNKDIHIYNNVNIDGNVGMNSDLIINSNLNLKGNLSVSDKLILLSTNSLLAYGKTILKGKTVINGELESKISILKTTDIKNENKIHTKELHADKELIFPRTKHNSKAGTMFYDSKQNMFFGHYGSDGWKSIGGSDATGSATFTGNISVDGHLRVKQTSNLLNTLSIGIMEDSNDSSQFTPKLTINNSGNIETEGTVLFKDTFNVKKLATLDNGLSVNTGITSLNNGLTVNQLSTLNNDLIVKKESTLQQNLNVLGNINANNDLIVKKESKLEKNLNVLGNINVNNDLIVKKESKLEKNLNVFGNINVNNDLIVKKESKLEKNLNVLGNINVNNDLIVKKESTLHQNLNVLGNINIDGDIIPSKHETYNLGSDSRKFKDLYLSGSSIHLGSKKIQLVGDDINFDSLLVNNDLTVNKNVVVKDTISVDKDSTFKQNVDVSGNVNIDDDLVVDKKALVKDTLTVTKAVQLNDNLVVEQQSRLKQNVVAESNVTVNQNLLVKNETTLEKNVVAKLDMTINQNLIVDNETTLKKNVVAHLDMNVNNNLNVAKESTLQQNLNVLGNINLNDDLVVDKKALVKDTLTVTKAVQLNDNLVVDKESILKKNVNVSGNVNIGNDLVIDKKALVNDTLTVAKGVQLNDTLTVAKGVLLNDNLVVDKETTLKKNVNVSGNVNIDNNLVVSDSAKLNQNVNVLGNLNIDEGLILPNKKNNSVVGSVYYDNSNHKFYGYYGGNKNAWKNLGGIDDTEDTVVYHNLTVNRNINVLKNHIVNNDLVVKANGIVEGNLNINEGLILPNKKNNSVVGSVYYDNSNHKFYGYYGGNKNAWKNLGGIDDTEDTVVYHNLTVNRNINVLKSHVVNKDLVVKANGIVEGNLNINEGLILPNKKNNSVVGSVYYDNSNHKFYGYYGGNKNAWKNLGGIDDTEDTVVYHNLTVNRNINVLKNHIVNNDLVVKANGIVEGNLNINEGLILPNKKNNSVVGSVYYDKGNHKFFGYYGGNKNAWKNLGGIDDTEDTVVYHNLTINRNTSISGNLVISNDILPLATNKSNIGSYLKKFNNIHANHLYVSGNSLWIGEYNKIEADANNNLKFRKINRTKIPKTIYNKLSNLDNSHNLKLTSRVPTASLLSEINSVRSSNVVITATTLNLVSDQDWINLLNKNNIELDGGNAIENLYIIEDNEDEKSDLTGLNNVIINKNLNVLGNVNIENGLVLPNNVGTTEGSLYIKYNSSSNENELKLSLNNIENSIFLNKGHLSHLTRSTDLFQFYNVYKNIISYGNRITGLSDPQFTSFSKFYVLQEYIFNEEETIIDNVEFYISTSTASSNSVTDLKISIVKMSATNTEQATIVNNVNIADSNTIKGKTYLKSLSDLKFIKNDRIKIKLVSSNDSINGSEVFCRLVGTTKIYPVIDSLNITSSSNSITVAHSNALRVNGGGYFGETLKAKTVHATNISSFTGSHISELNEMNIINDKLCKFVNGKLIYREGLIVNIKDVLKTDISDSKFEVRLSDKFNEKKIFGVINSYLEENDYLINSLGEGGIWVSNINGEIENGDYITSSSIPGFGCKQTSDMLHNYTVAKCCCNIDWNNVNEVLLYNNINYKIKFIACTYHCG